MSLSTTPERRKRLDFVQELKLLGLGEKEIAELLKTSRYNVRNDFDWLKRRQLLYGPVNQKEKYRAALRRYLESRDAHEPTIKEHQAAMFVLLGRYLGIEELRQFHRGTIETLLTLSKPLCSAKCEPYRDLCFAVMRERNMPVNSFDALLDAFKGEKALPLPASKREFQELIVHMACNEKVRQMLAPVWSDDVSMFIDALLKKHLLPNWRSALEFRFGLGGPKLAKAETAESMKMTKQRVRSLEYLAISRLRQRVLSTFHTLLRGSSEEVRTMTMAGMRQAVLETFAKGQADAARIEADVDGVSISLSLMLRDVRSAFELLSVRSSNCLQNAVLVYLGDLIVKDERELLKTKNFGRKSLKEVKEKLALMGLRLGVKVPSGMMKVFAEAKRLRSAGAC